MTLTSHPFVKPGKPIPPFGEQDIMRCIPHRDPMLMLSKVIAVGERSIDVEHHVAADREFFKGHFPNRPIMPGVLIIETVAQAGAMLIDLTCELNSDKEFMAFTGVDKAKFRQPVQPGDTICVHLKIARQRGPLYKFEASVKVNDSLVASVDFTASIMKF